MTQTTTTAQPPTIPAAGLEHRSGNLVATVTPHPQAGYRIQVRIAGVFNAELSSGHVYEYDALRAWNTLVAQYPAPVEPAPALAPAAKGTQTAVSDPGHTALVVAAMNGRVERGGKEGQVGVKTLTAMAKRGYLQLTYETGRRDARKVVTGGTLTGPGRIRLAQLTCAEREAAEFAARLAATLNPTTPAQHVHA
jgi:hypothetical protein